VIGAGPQRLPLAGQGFLALVSAQVKDGQAVIRPMAGYTGYEVPNGFEGMDRPCFHNGMTDRGEYQREAASLKSAVLLKSGIGGVDLMLLPDRSFPRCTTQWRRISRVLTHHAT
jgi:hypothetical protein